MCSAFSIINCNNILFSVHSRRDKNTTGYDDQSQTFGPNAGYNVGCIV
ncbi:unnamed protein product [Callosobruchus maculatus]|uniref:Uncharacterized protein n=1 Tax=Callosobruchus maculatus TaxID=64391 RepID=A0A653BFY1_CALMS|nr:unnamed protein product [Callosobruchus maculatus]